MQINIHIRNHTRRPSRLVFLIFFLLALFLYFVLNFLPKESHSAVTPESEQAQHSAIKLPPLQVHKQIIRQGYSLSDILEEHQFTASQIYRMREDVKPLYDLAKIKAGQELRFFSFENGDIVSVEYDIDRMRYLNIQKLDQDYAAEIRVRAFEIREKLIWGVIEDFPINALARQGETAPLAILMEEIFAWDVDFRTEIQTGDSYKILFEKKFVEGKFSGYGRILAAEFVNRGHAFQAFRFAYPDTEKTDYFDYEGKSLRKEFLKTPLKAPRVTSRFSSSRLHPVWKTYRPHYGVDYGAPVGTRVYATGDGVVTFAGWSGQSGRMVRIRHNKGYETMYLHLRAFAPGIKKGARVQMNQYLAQVGASGAVSGPHLDYRIKHHGNYINPLAARFDPVEPLREEFREVFLAQAQYYRVAFDAPWIVYSALARTSLFAPQIEIGD